MQTTVQKVNSVRFGSWTLYVSTDNWVSWTNLWALKDATLNVSKNIIEFVADNCKLPPKVKVKETIFSANLYEVVLDNLQKIDWMADYSTVDWTATSVTWETLSNTWLTTDNPVKLANKNWDNTKVGSITVYADWTALTEGTDYDTFTENDWYSYIYPLKDTSWTITVDYTYTPLASKQQLYKDIIKTLATNRFKFENKDEDGKVFWIEFYEGYNRAGIEAKFLADETTDDALNIPLEIKAYPTPDQKLFRIYDEQDV